MARIVYLDEEQGEVDIAHFLVSLQERGLDRQRLEKLIAELDFTGAPIIPARTFDAARESFDDGVQDFLDELVIKTGEGYCLRGRKYYLDVAAKEPAQVIEAVIRDTLRLQDLIKGFDFSDLSLDQASLALSLLDHKKHFSIIALTALYAHMLNDPDFPLDIYESFSRAAKHDINNYYSFLLEGIKPNPAHIDACELEVLKTLGFPKDTERESAASKLVLREMDHPGQIVLYAGNLLRWDGEQRIDAVVNPLFGAVEIGYALQSVLGALGIDKIVDVYFVRYSLHREGHDAIECNAGHVPEQLTARMQDLAGRRIFIIDDMYNRGTTLTNLRDFFRQYSNDVFMGAVEMNHAYHEKRGSLGECLSPSELAVPPVAEWRYVKEIERIILSRV